jgi:hypothetical protein
LDLFPWDAKALNLKWSHKFGNREVVQLLKPRMNSRKINENGFYEIGIIEE